MQPNSGDQNEFQEFDDVMAGGQPFRATPEFASSTIETRGGAELFGV
jgi:hypothetical protein